MYMGLSRGRTIERLRILLVLISIFTTLVW